MYCGDGDIRIIDYQPATKKLIFDIDINNVKMGWRWVMEEEDTILWSLPGQVTCNTELTISSSPTKIKHQERLGIWRDHKQSFPLQITHNLWHAGWREAFGSHLGQSCSEQDYCQCQIRSATALQNRSELPHLWLVCSSAVLLTERNTSLNYHSKPPRAATYGH